MKHVLSFEDFLNEGTLNEGFQNQVTSGKHSCAVYDDGNSLRILLQLQQSLEKGSKVNPAALKKILEETEKAFIAEVQRVGTLVESTANESSTPLSDEAKKIEDIVLKYFTRTDAYGNPTEVETNKDGFWVNAQTKDRGPRTDHGGGSDGDGWMDDEQVNSAAAPYKKKWQPKIDAVVKEIEALGYDVKGYFEYGEKGHVGAQFVIKHKK